MRTSVTPSCWELYFGDHNQRGAQRRVGFALYPASDSVGLANFGGTVIAHVDGAVFAYRREA